MKRGIALLIVFSLVVSVVPASAVPGTASQTATGAATAPQVEAVERSSGASESANYTTGRPVDNVTVETTGNRLSLLVSDDKPSGTPLILNRSWLRSELGKPVEFMRFHREGGLVKSYKVTPEKVFIDIPHFSTQNVTVTTVDGQFEVSGSASGQETQRVINYDVNETGIAILEIHGQGTREGQQRVDQFYSQVDNSTFQWETGEIPRNVTLEIVGQGSKLGPEFNKSQSGVSNGETVFFDLAAKDYQTNVTITGAGQKKGTVVTKGRFNGSADGDTETVTFDFERNNESFVLIGNTTTTTTEESHTEVEQEPFDQNNATASNNITIDNGQLALEGDTGASGPTSDPFIWYAMDEGSGTTIYDEYARHNGTFSGDPQWRSGEWTNDYAIELDGTDDYIETTSWGGWGGDLTTNWTIAVTIETTQSSDGMIISERQDSGNTQIRACVSCLDGSNGQLEIFLRDENGNDISITTEDSFNDGEPKRVIFRKTGNDAEDLEIWVNGTKQAVTVQRNGGMTSGENFDDNVDIGVLDSGNSNFFDGIIDDVVVENDTLTSTEIEEDFDRQPWSPGSLSDIKSSGYYERQYTTSEVVEGGKLNWTDDETGGTVQWYISPDGISWTEMTNSEDVWQILEENEDIWVRANLTYTSGDGPVVDEYTLTWNWTETTTTTIKTEAPAIDIDGDGVDEVSETGKLDDGETVVVEPTEDIPAGTHTFTVSTANDSVVDWEYEGNNEARAHVKNFTLNGHDYTVDRFLADGESTVITVDTLHTLQGQNSLTLNTYTDSETTHVSRIDVRGHYEGRTVVDNYTVNGQQSNLDAALADGESETVNISTESIYGTNDITVELKGNSTQDNHDAEVVWYPENRTYFSNVTVGGTDFGSPTFLAQDETLVFNVTDAINPGDNDHVFRMQSQKTTTDTLDFVEKVNFYKNISVTIEEQHATYNKTSTETFDHAASNVEFNFSIPDRAFRHVRTSVVFNGTQTGIQNTTDFDGSHLTVQVDEDVPKGTEVTARIKLLKYRLLNADDTLRDENTLGEPYRVDVGVSSVTGNVTYETVEADLTTAEWEIILTQNGEPYNETTEKVTFVDGNVTVPESYFGDTDGLIVQRPRYSTVTYTGTVNTIHPTPRIEPNRTVVHRPALFADLDQTYVRMENYSVQDLSSPLEIEWKQVGPYHLQWVTNESGTYNQTIENVTSNGVSVFADGERYRNFWLTADGDLVIAVNGSTTWDVYQYDYPTVASDTNVSVKAGQNKTVEIEVHNPNDFTLHDVELALTHGWVESVEPQTQDIGPGETATFNVTIDVPFGTQETTYGLPMNLTSTETGEIDTKDIEVTVGGSFPGTAGAPISRFGLILGGVVLFAALLIVHLSRTGRLEDLKSEIEEI